MPSSDSIFFASLGAGLAGMEIGGDRLVSSDVDASNQSHGDSGDFDFSERSEVETSDPMDEYPQTKVAGSVSKWGTLAAAAAAVGMFKLAAANMLHAAGGDLAFEDDTVAAAGAQITSQPTVQSSTTSAASVPPPPASGFSSPPLSQQ
jgi:hypothetical protein